MKSSWGLPLILVTILFMSSSSGCLGLLQMRETMEDLREAPKVEIKEVKVSQIKTFNNLFEWEEYQNTSTIYIDDSVIDIIMYQKVKLTGSDLREGCLEEFTRYVRAELLSPSGESVWSIDVCQNVDAKTDQILPEPSFEIGTWKLVINARGFGSQAVGAFQDSFHIDLTIHRPCTTYPIEGDKCI